MSESPEPTTSDDPASDDPARHDCGDDRESPVIDGEVTDEQMLRIAKAIADPQRFAILCAISKQDEIPCKSLVAQFPVTQATISHHLKELVASGLIRSRRQGQMAILSCRRDVCDAYTKMLTRRLAK